MIRRSEVPAAQAVAINPEFTKKPHFTQGRQRIVLPKPVQNNFHYEEFTTREARSERIRVLQELKIQHGIHRFTEQRDGKIVWVLAIPCGVKK